MVLSDDGIDLCRDDKIRSRAAEAFGKLEIADFVLGHVSKPLLVVCEILGHAAAVDRQAG